MPVERSGQLGHANFGRTYDQPAVTTEALNFDPLKAISEAMTAVHGVTYTYGQSRDILYPSSGTSKDWVLDDFQVPLRNVFKFCCL